MIVIHSGQTGVERGAQRAANAVGFPLAGFSSVDRRDELGPLPDDVARNLTPCCERGSRAPVLGVNLGSLGFTTEVPPEDLFHRLDEVFAGRYRVDERMKLSCSLSRDGKVLLEEEVLNDVVLSKGALARIADHEMLIDGEYVTTYKADGVIISTPTGSTAYSLSAGGPIVHPSMECVVISPICSHALTQRSLVVAADRTITVVLKGGTADVFLTMDGQVGQPLQSGDRVEVRRSPSRFQLIRNPAMSYFQVLRQKLHWGER